MAAYQYVYHMSGVSKTYPGGKKCFENIHLNFLPGVKIGVVGVNGAGKSTLMKIMAGLDTDFTGEAWSAEGAKVGYLPQEPHLDETLNVRENVMLGVAAKKAKLDRFNELAMNYSDETADEMAELQDQIDTENLWDLDSQVDVAMEALRCPADDADIAGLSGGERRRAGFWNSTVVRGIPYEGNYSAWLEQKAKRLAQEAREDKSKQKTLERELEWMRQGAKARQAKSKARIQAYDELASQSEREKITRAQIVIPNGPRLGNKVIEVEGLKKAMGDKLLIEDLSFSLPPGGIVGVIGPNGAGKSTLFKMLTGQEQPDEGTVSYGDTVQLSYVDQSRDDLNP
ncbi:Energy-dependent translational throttle protein EttA [Nymphon striatum]|nr:Energy-dependent translational throttle protein EttA [Nymphon striatum]